MKPTTHFIALKSSWPLFLVLLVFVVLKIPHLNYPFFWDESTPYAAAVKQMYYNGPSLLPGAVSSELGRGHPLLFHFLAAWWMKVFGASNIAMHSFPLLISILFAIAIYETGLRLYNKEVAITALLLIVFQQIFFVQSSFVLLEILLAFLAFISIVFYANRRYVLLGISLTLLFYTKESGLVLGLVLGIDAVMGWFNKKDTPKHKIYTTISLAVPLLFISSFFVIQKNVHGWYFFPLHTDNLGFHWDQFYSQFRSVVKTCFSDGYRKVFFLLICSLSIVAAAINKTPKYLGVLIPLPFTVLLCSDEYHDLVPGFLLLLLWVSSILFIGNFLVRKGGNDHGLKRGLLRIFSSFLVLFTLFAAYNTFFIVRYMLIVLVPLLFVAALYYHFLINSISKKLFIPGLLAMLLIQSYAYVKDNSISDVTLGAFDGMYVQQAPVTYLEENNYYNKNISIFQFLQLINLTDTNNGFRSTPDAFSSVQWGINDSTDIVLLENIESSRAADTSIMLRQDTSFVMVQRTERGKAWSEVFVRKRLLKK